ncbi:MAG TPA: DUF2799 domain-containing protein [Pseudobdellovibrionaceae bacterium]|jgi:hypothetical protein
MSHRFNKILSLVLVLFTVGCANWALQDKCEKTNWFEYSQNVAYQGKYLEEDGLIKACKGIDSTSAVQLDLGFKQGREKMCQYDEIFTRAKEGIPVFFKFCDGLDMNRMRSLYQQGLVTYCTAEKGYSFAKAGKLYQNLCSPQQEKAFLPGYYKGRKEYLTNYINELNSKLVAVKELEASYARTETNIHREYATLPSNATECHTITVYNDATKQNEIRSICEEAAYIRGRRSVLWSDLDHIRIKLREVRADWKDIESNLSQAQTDLNSIP